jgi:hypothetical protein
VNGLFAAFGPVARRFDAASLDRLWPRADGAATRSAALTAEQGFLYRPCCEPRHRAAHESSSLQLLLDGYLFSQRAAGAADAPAHLAAVHDSIAGKGPQQVYDNVLAGAFNLAGLDDGKGEHFLLNDHFGTLPLYYFENGDGLIACTNPSVLAMACDTRFDIDTLASAELILLGYALGDRHFLRGVHVLPPGSLLRWSHGAQRATRTRMQFQTYAVAPQPGGPDVDQVADALEAACARIHALDPLVGHLQSGGMDSRAILAAWPQATPPHCYTYGRAESAEVHVAREVARTKGVPFMHWLTDGDAVAGAFDQLFDVAGMIVYPDRYLVAQRMAADGIPALLDGFLGDVFAGGTYYHSDRYGAPLARAARFLTVLIDAKVATVGLDQLSEIIYDDIVEYSPALGELPQLLDADVVSHLRGARRDIVADIRSSLEYLRSPDDSTALTFRNFLVAARGLHAIGLQAVMCRAHLEVYFPFTNDVPLLSLLLSVPPSRLAYRRMYIELFRRRYPAFAELPIDSSGLPLRRGPLAHKWSVLLRDAGIVPPGLRSVVPAQHVRPINWGGWMKESANLRQRLIGYFADSPLIDRAKLHVLADRLGRGENLGGGKLPQLAALSRWHAIAGRAQTRTG